MTQIWIGGGVQFLPLARKKLVDPIDRRRAHPHKKISEIFKGIDAI
jgi:hypothetical protein